MWDIADCDSSCIVLPGSPPNPQTARQNRPTHPPSDNYPVHLGGLLFVSCAATLYFNRFLFFWIFVFVKIRTKRNKTKLTEPNFTKSDQLSKPQQTWLNQIKLYQVKILCVCLWKSEQNWATKIWQNQTNQTKPKMVKHKYSLNQVKPNATEPNQTKPITTETKISSICNWPNKI